MPFKPRGDRRPCPSEFYFCPGPSRFLICGTSFTARSVIPLLSSPSFTLWWCLEWDIGKEEEIRMKRTACLLAAIGLLVLCAGCKKQESDADAIRSGINQHLASLKTLNLAAMDMN